MTSLFRQRGFIYLTTGANGTGKTLFTLADVRKLQEETGRPVFFTGFVAKQPLLDFGWKPFEPANWQDLPDGAICVVDECHEYLPVRATGRPPAWVEAIAKEHRKRGFDFFLITQHPLNIDSFVRRTIAAPGWHRHFKASTMGDSSNELRWTSVVDQPQKPNSGDSGEVKSRPFPSEVYGWYESASVHTAKKGIPRKVWLALLGLVAAVGMVGYAVTRLMHGHEGLEGVQNAAKAAVSAPTMPVVPNDGAARSRQQEPMTAAEYVKARTPRLPDFAHTAPAYDQVTAPTVAPYPAACVQMGKSCRCYSQQATLLQVSGEVCLQIVKQGFFMDWAQQPKHEERERQRPYQVAEALPGRRMDSAPVPVPGSAPEQVAAQSEWSRALAARNAQVRSSMER